MDIKRIALIASILVVGYMLMLEYRDFDALQTVKSQGQVAPTQNIAELSSDASDIPSAHNTLSETSNSDIPEIPSAFTESDIPQAHETTVSAHIITVKTSTINVNIDLIGGDIVGLNLPQYPLSLEHKETPFILLQQDHVRTYIAQSGLTGANGIDKKSRAQFTSAQKNYELTNQNSIHVDLIHVTDSGVQITKRFEFIKNSYQVNVSYIINNQSNAVFKANLFAQIKRDGSSVEGSDNFAMRTFIGAAISTPVDTYQKFDFSDMDEENKRESSNEGWIAFIQHYFVSAWIPEQNQSLVFTTRKTKGQYIVGFTGPQHDIAPGTTGEIKTTFYAGPKIKSDLKDLAKNLDLTVDYGMLFFIAEPLFWLLDLFHDLVGNWGVAIILVTLAIKALFYYPSKMSYTSMANMRRLQPELARLKEEYGSDRQKMSSAMMNLYKKEKINPLGGCLPILLQMPVFIALYWTLVETVELRQAPFFLWIHDLSVMDPYFILPLIMGVTMFFQQTLNPAPADPMQAKVMKMMPIMFTFFFLWFPAGLVLYWVANNVLSIAQQWYITKKIEKLHSK